MPIRNIYTIGDVQGCYDSLQSLLTKINFDLKHDQLWFVGDIVNRGCHSLATLRFIKSLGSSAVTVLGNHDLFLLAAHYGFLKPGPQDTIDEILHANDCEELIDWLKRQPIVHHYDNYLMVHAGIPPQWDLAQTKVHADELSHALVHDTENFLQHMFGNDPLSWSDSLSNYDRLRYITNAFTRMRYCHADSTLDLTFKDKPEKYSGTAQPWFTIKTRKTKNSTILFGHWASLEGKTNSENVFALDTGCSWGETLTALRLSDQQLFSVPAEITDLCVSIR